MRQMENLRSSVYEVVLERLNRIFSDFDNVYVFRGKDSGVLLNLCIDYIRQNKLNRRLGYFISTMKSNMRGDDALCRQSIGI